MDNLTHSLVGAVLGQMGLKRRTGLAMPALIIGANLPDIDGVSMLLGMNTLTARRGLTHGPIAMAVLPLLLTGALLLWARFRPNPGRPPIHRGWLLGLAYIGTLTHPALDWLNSYGIRLLSPFSNRWFAGDTLFIIDVWIWTALALAVWLSRRREKAGRNDWRAPAVAGFAAVCVYIAANGLITRQIEAKAAETYEWKYGAKPELVVANPVPVIFWTRDVLWRGAAGYGEFPTTFLDWRLISARPDTDIGSARPVGMNDQRIALARTRNPDAHAFLFWSRMPVASVDGGDMVITDQRFMNELTRGRFEVRVPLKDLR